MTRIKEEFYNQNVLCVYRATILKYHVARMSHVREYIELHLYATVFTYVIVWNYCTHSETEKQYWRGP